MKLINQISFTLILLFCLSRLSVAAGDTILNKYARIVELFNYNKDDPDSFRINKYDSPAINKFDTIVIYQAKGVEWDSTFGDCLSNYRFAGRFEFHVVINISGDTIILPSALNYDPFIKYSSDYAMQAIRVASYKKFVSDSLINLVAAPLDSGKGGVFAMMVDTLELKSNIDVSAKGFKGGNPLTNAVNLACSSGIGNDNNNYSYWAKDKSGLKGESVCIFDSLRMRGKLPLYNGGGGGNGYYAGGGGGSNYGIGGEGGYEAYECSPNPYNPIYNSSRGQPGFALQNGLLSKSAYRAVFGGGGGCSVIKSPAVASKGGNGGGIVLLVANVIKGRGHQINANGESVTATSTAGAGGGGGGGAIFLDINQCIGNLTLTAQGGKGGNTISSDTAGPGGGGGAGYIYYNGTSLPGNIIAGINELKGGLKGTNLRGNSNRANPGGPGDKIGNLVMPVKDVLFNIMPVDQKICEGESPKLFKASHPKGGGGIPRYRYIWLNSINKIVWDTIANDTTSIVYQEGILHNTTYYKRIVKSTVNGETFTDISTILTVVVLPAIGNNTISILGQDTLCSGISFPKLKGKIATGGGGNYVYLWQDSINSVLGWQNASGINDTLGYQSTDTITTKFRRIVTAGFGVCKDTSSVGKITVLPLINHNAIGDTQWLSKGDTARYLRSKQTLDGGDGIYRYLWQQKQTTTTWVNAAPVNSNSTYIIPPIIDTFYYKRIVFSGENNTCSSTSNILTINVLDSLRHNVIISGTQTICGRTSPISFVCSKPHGGDESTTYYRWEEKRSDGLNWNPIDTITNIDDTIFNPGIIDPGITIHDTSFRYFRRVALSGHNDCCKDTSNSIVLTVLPYIKDNIILNTDTIICFNQKSDSIIAVQPIDGDGLPYIYIWQDSLNNNNWSAIPGANELHYKSSALTDTTYFRRKVTAGICTSYSNALKITVLDTIGNNIIKSDSSYVCIGSKPTKLNGQMPNGGESHIYSYYWRKSINNSTWTSAPNSVITDTSYQPDTTSIKLYFKRIVKSGLHDCCIDTSSVFTIGIHELPTDIITVFNDSLCLDSTYIIHHKLTGQPDFKIGYTDGTSNYDTSGVNVFNFDQPFRPQTAKKLNYSVTSVIDGNNCIAKKIIGSGILSVFNNPKANISGTKDSVCERVVKLDAHPSYGTGIWKSYDGVTFDNNVDSATSATAPDYGQYSVTWSENNGGCIDSAEIKISFFEQPKQSEVIVGENQEGPFKFRTTLNATSPSIGKGIWSSPDNSIYFDDRTKPKTFVDSLKFGINYFIWTITNGVCVPVWDTLKVTTNDIKVPHGFSPNLDAINDTFKILGLEYTKNSELTILNKWGGVVYQSGDYKNDWTGTYKGNALPEDTYFYILNVKKINRIYKGFLVIRR